MLTITPQRFDKKTVNLNFHGRLNIPNEKLFINLINNMDYFEKVRAERTLRETELQNIPKGKTSILVRVLNLFSKKNKTKTEQLTSKTLKDFWMEALNEMATLATNKLPNEYVLRCRKSNLSKGSMSFRITKGKEFIYGVSAFITDPNFPLRNIKGAIEKISDLNFEKNFKELKKDIPTLTENEYLTKYCQRN